MNFPIGTKTTSETSNTTATANLISVCLEGESQLVRMESHLLQVVPWGPMFGFPNVEGKECEEGFYVKNVRVVDIPAGPCAYKGGYGDICLSPWPDSTVLLTWKESREGY